MIVYRYEHPKKGTGPYWNEALPEMRRAHNNSRKHPAPHWEGLRMPTRRDRAAMPSMKDLRRWFWGYNQKLKALGYVVRAYKVPDDVPLGRRSKQAVFDLARAKPLPTPPLPRAAKGKRSARGTSELRSL